MKRTSMKKILLLCTFFILLFGSVTVNAKTTYKYGSKTYTYKKGNYKMYYEGKLVTSKKYPALMIHDSIMIPYSNCLVKNGPKVKEEWNKKKKRLILTHNGTQVKLFADKKYMYVNGKKQSLYTQPLYATVNGKKMLYIPAKAVSAALDFQYEYKEKKKKVYITKKDPVPTKTNTPAENVSGNQSSTGTVTNIITNVVNTIKGFTAEVFNNLTTKAFIEKMGPVAREDYQKTGILASVTLAQAILESGWGKSELAQKGNNLFGMKTSLSGNTWAGSSWDGKSYVTKETKEYDGADQITIVATFRKYQDVASSIADHSAYLSNAKNGKKLRYEGLTTAKTYKEQLEILHKGGYCTSNEYVNKLTKLIKDYDLTKYDVK